MAKVHSPALLGAHRFLHAGATKIRSMAVRATTALSDNSVPAISAHAAMFRSLADDKFMCHPASLAIANVFLSRICVPGSAAESRDSAPWPEQWGVGMERSYAVRWGTRYRLTPTTPTCREFGAPEGPDNEGASENCGKVVSRAAFFLKDSLICDPALFPLENKGGDNHSQGWD